MRQVRFTIINTLVDDGVNNNIEENCLKMFP